MIRFVVAFLMCLAVPVTFAADAKTDSKATKKKSASKKKSEPKASSQDWGRFNSSASKSLDEKAKKDAAKKK